MYDELRQQFDAIGYDFEPGKLQTCAIRAPKKQVIKAMLIEAKRLNFDVYSNQVKAVLALIATENEISAADAVNTLRQYASSDAYDPQMVHGTLFSAALGVTE
ncbi:hypothetical protein ACQKP8_23365 [Photobacterium alginatilyticum]|uniref:hypothetical protein n=1 Tax=Photobacterium alginatilyticum TaxID=1775171 RepID=UPI004068A7CF